MKTVRILLTLALVLVATGSYSQILPSTYQGTFNEIIENFKTIRGANSITQGKTTLGVVNANKISLKTTHKKKVKNLTFITELDEENNLRWIAANQLTIDMVNKYEDDVSKMLETMLKLSEKKSKE